MTFLLWNHYVIIDQKSEKMHEKLKPISPSLRDTADISVSSQIFYFLPSFFSCLLFLFLSVVLDWSKGLVLVKQAFYPQATASAPALLSFYSFHPHTSLLRIRYQIQVLIYARQALCNWTTASPTSKYFCIHTFIYTFFWDRVSLHSPNCSCTHGVDQADLKLTETHLLMLPKC